MARYVNVTAADISASFTDPMTGNVVQISVPAKTRVTIPDSYNPLSTVGLINESELAPPSTLTYADLADMVLRLPYPLVEGQRVSVSPGYVFEVNDAGRIYTLNGSRLEPYVTANFSAVDSLSAYSQFLVRMVEIRNDYIAEIEGAAETTKLALGLDQVDNTSDVAKPLSATAIAALAGKAAASHAHTIADVSGLQTALDGKSGTGHTHALTGITGLQAALDAKASLVHTHLISNVVGLQIVLDGKSPLSHAHTVADVVGLQAALDAKMDLSYGFSISDIANLQTTLDGKAATVHSHAIADVAGLQALLTTQQKAPVLRVQEQSFQSGTYVVAAPYTFEPGDVFILTTLTENAGSSFISFIVGGSQTSGVPLVASDGSNLAAGYLKPAAYLVAYVTGACRVLTVNASTQTLLAEYNALKSKILAGKFLDGTAVEPAIAFQNDTNTGLFRSASDVLAFATGGVARGYLSASGLALNVPVTGTAVTMSNIDTQSGRLTKVGDGGLLGYTPTQAADTYWSDTESTRFIGSTTAGNTPLDKPVSGQAFVGLHIMRSSSNWCELVGQVTGDSRGDIYVRAKESTNTSAWNRLLAASEVAASTTEATVGKLFRVGDYGLGSNLIPMTGGAQLSTRALRTGLYTGQSSNIPDLPDLTVQNHSLLAMQADRGVSGTQRTYLTVRGETAAAMKAWLGTHLNTSTVEWSELYHNNNVVGTVTQVMGVPTGAIVQRGANTNGEYVKYADGTQVCWGVATSSASAEVAVLFPAAFISTTTLRLVFGVVSANNQVMAPRSNSKATSGFNLSVYTTGDTRIDRTVEYVAYGRWF